MSRNIDQEILDELETSEITTFHLLEYTVNSTTYYYTDCDVPISYATDGTNVNTYNCRSFAFDNVSYSDNNIVDSCSIRIDNLDGALTAIFIGNIIVEESAILHMVVFDDDINVIGSQQIFNGLINDFNIDETELNMTVTSIFTKWNQVSQSKHSALCRWKKFKGTECTYSGGSTTCDRTYSRCSALSNTDNFGGFRWLPAIEDKQIWWGPNPSQRKREG